MSSLWDAVFIQVLDRRGPLMLNLSGTPYSWPISSGGTDGVCSWRRIRHAWKHRSRKNVTNVNAPSCCRHSMISARAAPDTSSRSERPRFPFPQMKIVYDHIRKRSPMRHRGINPRTIDLGPQRGRIRGNDILDGLERCRFRPAQEIPDGLFR
jgi:hypothetical protein